MRPGTISTLRAPTPIREAAVVSTQRGSSPGCLPGRRPSGSVLQGGNRAAGWNGEEQGTAGRAPEGGRGFRPVQATALTISSVTFLASPNSIIVLGLKNSSLSTPA